MNSAEGMSFGERANSSAALAPPSFEVVTPVLFMATLNQKALIAAKTVKANRNNRHWLIQFKFIRCSGVGCLSAQIGDAQLD